AITSPCIEFNSVSPTDLKMGLMESKGLKMLWHGLMREGIKGLMQGLIKGLMKERIIKNRGFLNRFL
ncbi:hypothetical protein, partial [Helicobacter pylori]|uniref:hypothetical protein n=1 Tax=Helicobacter pylori TaxID=210 RepID=UPI000BEE6FBA